jgi:hypothetical protein
MCLSADDFYHHIKSRRGEDMRAIIHAGLEYKKISNATPDMQAIVHATTDALERLASESKLNSVRIKRYGIVPRTINSAAGTQPTGGIKKQD